MKYLIITLLLIPFLIYLVVKTARLDTSGFVTFMLSDPSQNFCRDYQPGYIGPIKECDTRGGVHE